MENRADTLILGNIITMDDKKPTAQAVTVLDGKIQYVGSRETAKTLCDKNTKVLDYGDSYVYPGFLEAHAHGLMAGWREMGQIDLSAGKSYEDYQRILRNYIKKHPGHRYYFGAGWQVVDDVSPTKALIDKVCADVPIALNSLDGHSMLFNQACIDAFHATKEIAQQFKPGEIEVDENGELTGLMHETPTLLVLSIIPLTLEEVKQFTLGWQQFAFSLGIVGASEAGLQSLVAHTDQAYLELAKEGKLKIRTYSYRDISEHTTDPKADVEKIADFAAKNNSEYFKTVGIKVFNDGVVEAHTAWLDKDYEDRPGYHGVERHNDHQKMVTILTTANKYGLAVHSHSIGSGAIKFQLDAIEDAESQTGNMDQRNCIAHLQVVRDDDIKRLGDLDVVAIVPPLWCPKYEADYKVDVDALGVKDADKEYPIKSFQDAGAVITFHSDYPVSPNISVPNSLYTAITRKGPGLGSESVRGIKEAASKKDALLAMTKNVAYLWHEEDRMGSLEVGKLANMAVFDTDFLNGDVETFPEAKVVATIVDGDVVYQGK